MRALFPNVFILLLLVSCSEPGLHRTRIDEWQARDLKYIGAFLEVPANVYRVVDSPIEAGILMNPYNPPRFVIDEPRCLLEIRIERISEKELADAQARSRRKERDKQSDTAYWNWYFERHDAIDCRESERYSYYRYDVRCGDGTLLQLTAEVMTSAVGQSVAGLAEDDATIRRILGSVECRDPKPMPTVAKD